MYIYILQRHGTLGNSLYQSGIASIQYLKRLAWFPSKLLVFRLMECLKVLNPEFLGKVIIMRRDRMYIVAEPTPWFLVLNLRCVENAFRREPDLLNSMFAFTSPNTMIISNIHYHIYVIYIYVGIHTRFEIYIYIILVTVHITWTLL